MLLRCAVGFPKFVADKAGLQSIASAYQISTTMKMKMTNIIAARLPELLDEHHTFVETR
jgi:hypothetical protein